MKRITVFGATGMIGRPVTQELVKAGFEVTALVREVDSSKQKFLSGVTFVKGNLDNKASIAESLKNAEAIYITLGTLPTDRENQFNPEMGGLDNILEVAKQYHNIKRIVYLSSFLARNYQGPWWVLNAKKSGIDRVKKRGIPYTIFYPSNFMENFIQGMVRNNKITFPVSSANNKAYWIAASDYGKQVAQSLKMDDLQNKEYPVQGPEALTMEEASRRYAANYSKTKLGVSSMSVSLMAFLGVFIPQLKYLSRLMGVMLNNKESFESQATWDALDTPQLTIEKFAQQQ